MSQQYGFRATNNLSEIIDRNAALDNLGIDRRDLALIVDTSAAGVTQADYQAIRGLASPLEAQIVTLTGYAAAQLSGISQVATTTGSVFSGTIISSIVNNDRPYIISGGTIAGPSTISYFSPTLSGSFSTGAEYKLGPITTATLTTSGVNYQGITKSWNNYFSQYKNYARFQEEPSWTVRYAPLYLPPPTTISGCITWLDAEFSAVELDENSGVRQWRGIENSPTAFQEESASRPTYIGNAFNGKPAIRFDGTNDSLAMTDLSPFFQNGATLVCLARVEDGDFNIFGTLNSTSNRWNNGTGKGQLGVFTTSVQTGFPWEIDSNGTIVYSIRISSSHGIEYRENGQTIDTKSEGFTYSPGSTFIIGRSGGSSGFFKGDIHAFALFGRVLSTKEIRTVEEYFAWRYDGIYDPDRTQQLQLETAQTIDLESDTPIVLGQL